jgi:hypothetical protein
VIVFDANSEETQAIMDTKDPETIIMLNTLRNVYFDQSYRLSNLVQDEFARVGRINRGARQRNEKGILVLHATAMPSVLVELGFISNPDEEKYLNSDNGQNELAGCIFNAVKKYKDELERVYMNAQVSRHHSTPPASAPAAAPAAPAAEPVNHIPANVSTTAETPAAKPVAENLSYKVQLMTTSKVYSSTNTLFKNLKGTIEREQYTQGKKKVNKYIWGSFRTEAEAQAAVYKARKHGFTDAFMLTYKDGERID